MSLTTSLLATKLFIPPTHQRLVARSRLVELLAQASNYKLTLICAPAGFGKTTLVTEWHQAYPKEALAWISLDEGDNEPERFLCYLVAAFKDFIPEDCEKLLTQLAQPQPTGFENILTALINSLSAYAIRQEVNHLFLALDDYQLIENETVHRAVTFLLEHLPPCLHLLITSRSDPFLPLHRWRAKNQLLEIRAADLRFRVEETAAFIERDSTFKHDLNSEDITLLTNRTEGWAVGLQLALLWLKGQENRARALQDFSGNSRFILEYLGEEVLARQPEPIRTFLLKSSILDRFNSNLANAVTGMEWSMEDLAKLEQANLFLIPLDSKGEWYSYHHLFREFLQHLLKKEQPQVVKGLYKKASQWFEETDIYQAIQYTIAATDYERCIHLINSIRILLLNRSRYTLLGRWLAQIPKTAIYEYPDLALFHAWVSLYNDNFFDDEEILLSTENYFRTNGNNDKLGEIFVIRAFSANYHNDLDATIEYATQALKLVAKENILMLGGITLALGRAYLNNGEIAKSREIITQSRHYNQQAGYLAGQSMCDRELGNLSVFQGKLSEAVKHYQQIIETLKDRPEEPIPVYIDLAKVYLEWNKLDTATHYTQIAEEFSLKTRSFSFLSACYLLRAKISLARQEINQSLEFLEKTTSEVAERPNKKLQAQLEAFRVQLWLQLGQDSLIENWYQTSIAQDEDLVKVLPFYREVEELALVRVLIARQQFSLAWTHLKALEQFGQEQGRNDTLIQTYLLMACVADYTNKGMVAETLEQALKLAQTGGYIRTFLNEGKSVETLLKARAATRDSLIPYLNTLLFAFKVQNEAVPQSLPISSSANPDKIIQVFEPLTERELEVLRLVARGASNREIGEQMVITLPTVKKHLSNIFGKLGVTSRTQALIRAGELALL